MASFREMHFTPAEFAAIAKIDRNLISELEHNGIIRTVKRRVGNVDRKMITLEDMQAYFRQLRANPGLLTEIGRRGDQIEEVAQAVGAEAPAGATAAGNAQVATASTVAAATARFAQPPKHK